MRLDHRDAALQRVCPCIPVPRFGALDPAGPGQRVSMPANGVFLEVRRSWLHCVMRLSTLPPTPPLPYGTLEERIRFEFDVIPIGLLQAFIQAGRAALPNEIAGALVFDGKAGLRLVVHEALEAGPDHVHYRIPRLLAPEEIAVDLHTHGHFDASWSADDDADDQCVKVCGVFGTLQAPVPTARFRLAVNGAFRALPHPWPTARPDVEHAQGRPTLVGRSREGEHPWST